LNRERKHKYQHPKGAPDADLIFGPKKVRWREGYRCVKRSPLQVVKRWEEAPNCDIMLIITLGANDLNLCQC
jgi:hypothetical protein